MFNQTASADTLEERLLEWAGGILSARRKPCAPPGVDRGLVDEFIRIHGIELLLPGWTGDRSSWETSQAEGGAMKGAVAAEMARNHEFVHVIKALQCAGLSPVVFKGQALAYTMYPQPWLRPRTDIDALIEWPSFEATVDVLTSLGYERTVAIDADLVLPQLSLHKHRHGMSHVWDLHWRISNRPALAEALTSMEILANTVETRVNDTAFLIPDRVYSLLIGCLHLVGHHADEIRLIWLYDLHVLVSSMNESEYERFLDRSLRTAPLQAACHAALEATQRYLPAERTDALCRALDPGVKARWAMDQRYLDGLLGDVSAIGRGNRLRFVAQHLCPSADYMIKRFGIRRRWQLPYWYVVRIARAIPKLFRRR